MAAVARAPLFKLNQIRPWAIAVLTAALMTCGVLVVVQSMTVDDQVREYYEEALVLSQLARETQQQSASLRNRQLWLARSLTPGTSLAPTSDKATFKAEITGLDAKLDEIGGFALSAQQKSRLSELKTALAEIADINSSLTEVAARGEADTRAVRELTARSQSRFEAFENALSELVGSVRLQAVSAARRADEMDLLGRHALIALFAVTIALGLLAVFLALRTLRANRALLGRMQQLAREDALTGAINRRGLDDVMPIEFARAQRSRQPLSIVMIDLDHFKRYNDRRGHPAGDAVLRGAAQAWVKQLRPTDMLARYGGEEFTLLLPATDAHQAALLVDRLRAPVPDRQTFSAGIATWDGNETVAEVLQRADHALLQAKKAGRNRSMIAGQEPQVTLPLMVA